MGPAQIKRELQKNGKLNCKMRSKDITTSECICTESDIAKLSTITKHHHQWQHKKKKSLKQEFLQKCKCKIYQNRHHLILLPGTSLSFPVYPILYPPTISTSSNSTRAIVRPFIFRPMGSHRHDYDISLK